MNDIYPSKELLRLRFNIQENNCTFCNSNIGKTDHLFFYCITVQSFWKDLQKWVKTIFPSSPTSFTRDHITFGVFLNNKQEELCINVILCIAKVCIHKSKYQKCPPNFSFFKNDLKLYIKSLEQMKGPKAIKLYSCICDIPLDWTVPLMNHDLMLLWTIELWPHSLAHIDIFALYLDELMYYCSLIYCYCTVNAKFVRETEKKKNLDWGTDWSHDFLHTEGAGLLLTQLQSLKFISGRLHFDLGLFAEVSETLLLFYFTDFIKLYKNDFCQWGLLQDRAGDNISVFIYFWNRLYCGKITK